MAMTKINQSFNFQFTFYDLHHIYGSIAESLDYEKYTIKKLLNHNKEEKNDVTAGYVQISDKKLRAAMNEIEVIVLGSSKSNLSIIQDGSI
ncbi:MAG: hypothetical protein BGO19_00570 [Acinetobacter sp. 38-8]|nr:MAG: hypothetical protein BGO19_00570 [Acinetobacter sp. 38-8]